MFVLVNENDGNDRFELESTTLENAAIEALEYLGYTILETDEN